MLVISIKAQPRARREGITGVWNGFLKIAVREPAENGKANDAILAVLCGALGLRKHSLQIISGFTSSKKQVSISGITETDLLNRIRVAAPLTTKTGARK